MHLHVPVSHLSQSWGTQMIPIVVLGTCVCDLNGSTFCIIPFSTPGGWNVKQVSLNILLLETTNLTYTLRSSAPSTGRSKNNRRRWVFVSAFCHLLLLGGWQIRIKSLFWLNYGSLDKHSLCSLSKHHYWLRCGNVVSLHRSTCFSGWLLLSAKPPVLQENSLWTLWVSAALGWDVLKGLTFCIIPAIIPWFWSMNTFTV